MPVIRGSNPTVADSLAAIVSAETTIGRPSPTTRRPVNASVSDNTRRGASTTDVILAGNWKTSRMVAHHSAGATAERGAVARYP